MSGPSNARYGSRVRQPDKECLANNSGVWTIDESLTDRVITKFILGDILVYGGCFAKFWTPEHPTGMG